MRIKGKGYTSGDLYINMFIDRQQTIRETGHISLSFTGRSAVAEEYSHGVRKFGEGPSHFFNNFTKIFF